MAGVVFRRGANGKKYPVSDAEYNRIMAEKMQRQKQKQKNEEELAKGSTAIDAVREGELQPA